jgi:DNA-binding response OmpR family regulator
MRILLVEDDRRLSELLARRLHEGTTPRRATTASTGWSETFGDFDLAILDVMLPGLDGISLASALRGRGSSLPVLMLTARDRGRSRHRSPRGADDYLVKPFAFVELLARIDALARRTGPVVANATS